MIDGFPPLSSLIFLKACSHVRHNPKLVYLSATSFWTVHLKHCKPYPTGNFHNTTHYNHNQQCVFYCCFWGNACPGIRLPIEVHEGHSKAASTQKWSDLNHVSLFSRIQCHRVRIWFLCFLTSTWWNLGPETLSLGLVLVETISVSCPAPVKA